MVKTAIEALATLLNAGRCENQLPIAKELSAALVEKVKAPWWPWASTRLTRAIEAFNAHPLGPGETDAKYLQGKKGVKVYETKCKQNGTK